MQSFLKDISSGNIIFKILYLPAAFICLRVGYIRKYSEVGIDSFISVGD